VNALILVAHGSRKSCSNADIVSLAEVLRESLTEDFSLVQHAFLELATPRLSSVIDHCIQQGVHSVTLLPYFLLSGHHVTVEIPQILLQKQQQHPHILLKSTPHLGQSPQLPQLLLSLLDLNTQEAS